jgi:hypothetical protein
MAIALTRASLDAVTSTSAATGVILALLTGVARTSSPGASPKGGCSIRPTPSTALFSGRIFA